MLMLHIQDCFNTLRQEVAYLSRNRQHNNRNVKKKMQSMTYLYPLDSINFI